MSEIERVFVRFRGRTIGPFQPNKIFEMIDRGQVTRSHELSADGLSWVKAEEFGNFFPQASSGFSDGSFTQAAGAMPPGESAGGDEGDDSGPVPNQNAAAQWYAHVQDEKQGPVSLDQLKLYRDANLLTETSLVWRSGMEAWLPAKDVVPSLFEQDGSDDVIKRRQDSDADVDGGTLATELSRNHGVVMAFAVAALLLGLLLVGVQIAGMSSNASGSMLKMMARLGKITTGVSLIALGAVAIQVSQKLKLVATQSSPIGSLVAAKVLNQFWAIACAAIVAGLIAQVVIAIMTVAMQGSLLEVLG
ncbi:hypothetical protein SV7mr_23770 [Stieleria bergensis]|uniref:GYF domain-containing protein n=1 Tax=Stieleria bergensis TaxID=2528025 RepID=A0A517SUQ8_9BACT|nr:hypothetical protein SV7mr_23770 [Planctomycetes bacterium SV_7m_r]